MHNYEQSIYQFLALRDKYRNIGILETDLPFLFEKRENKTGILMLHGSDSSPCNTFELGKALSEMGYTTMGVLLAGHGISTDNLSLVSWKDCYHSVIDAFYILEGMLDNIYILGSSFGGCLAYLAGIELSRKAAGIIALSAPSFARKEVPYEYHWPRQIYESIKAVEHNLHNLDLPCLIMHSVDDKVVKINQAMHAFDKIRNEQKKLLVYNKIGHSLGFGFNTLEVAMDINNFILSNPRASAVRFELSLDAEYVSLAGEFNNWDQHATPMFRYDNKWIVDILLPPGNYQYKFVINGRKWITDPSAEKAFTPKGGQNSLIRVS